MNDNFKHFESYRRERNKRRLEGAPQRDLGDNSFVLRQIEEAEQKEVREQQLTREVHEFFQAATKQAAGIVAHVTESAEEKLRASVTHEMAEFLQETIRRAQELMNHVAGAKNRGIARQELEPHIQNIVGPVLDGFRFAGDASTAEQHIGQDPFNTELEMNPQGDAEAGAEVEPQGAQVEPPTPEQHPDTPAHLRIRDASSKTPAAQDPAPSKNAAPAAAPAKAAPPVPAAETAADAFAEDGPVPVVHALQHWFVGLLGEPDRAKEALKLLVRSAMMTKDEARAIWQDVLATTD